MLTAVLATLNERRREMAILRAVGARPLQVFGLLLMEALLLTIAGALVGLLLMNGALAGLSGLLESRFGLHVATGWPSLHEWRLLGLVIAAGLVAGIIPAWLAYRRSVADGMTVRT
jgi:putative ABC transport system permease protein